MLAELADQRAPGRVGERREGAVERLMSAHLLILYHMVKR
jgi:hypothetical protein